MKLPFWPSPPPSEPPPTSQTGAGLGTFGGVFTPSILTILGVIMYLRFGWVVGQVGLWGTLAIVTLSTSITFLTSLSICAIATDQVVRAGGAYYMISRSLGIESGGAIGIPLYFAQAISVALYTIGFAESLVITFPQLNIKVVAIITTIMVAIIAIKSAKLAIKAQYFIMAAIALSLISLLFGSPVEASTQDIAIATNLPKVGFWQVFAVFFPAVTGIMAGVNMSGDLQNPTKSIPTGTLAAVGTGYVIYMLLPVLLWMQGDTDSLLVDALIMKRIAFWGPAILLGVWGATLSSALGSILGAPRVLQALAKDGILPNWLKFLGTGSGPDNEPRIATVVTLGFVLIAVAVGDLNLIAPVLSMFFLTTYLVLNLAAGIETFLESPSFRPTFKVHWLLSLLGVVGCLGVMFLIDAIATIIAAIIVFSIYIWLERRELESAWGDIRQGIWMALVRRGLFQLSYTPDTKNWRPHILTFSGAPNKRWSLVELAANFSHNVSLFTVCTILPTGSRSPTQRNEIEAILRDYLEKRAIAGLVRVIMADDPFTGSRQLVESYGIGPLVPNTILLGDSQSPERRKSYCETLVHFHKTARSVLILRDESDRGFGARQKIDLWWGGLNTNGGLMLILAYLLRTSLEWRGAEINLNLVVPDETAALAAHTNLAKVVAQLRIGAKPKVIVSQGQPFPEILRSSSQDADLVFLGMATPKEDLQYSKYYEGLQKMATGLPATIFVLAAPDFAFSEVLQKD
ncbi:amino acid permease-associated region [Limnospira indica]|uniref:Amino acid permease-associated region n=1 Tax=Limnospira indica PCC 8005 TaxID=376219 RepID=A0A9P1KK75_9CYAN|nr:amino acid permease-associated region [Limnospira indica]CDM97383.1 Amino acid permease-associated region [Limnospira indica PCC 8005]